MKKLFVLVAVMMLVMAASCDTLNIGTGGPERGPVPVVTFPAPANGWHAGEVATMTVDWGTTGEAPYTIAIAMGGGATADVPAGTAATSPFTMDFTLVEGGPFTYTVTVTDTNAQSGDATGTYTVGEALNEAPVITVGVAGAVVTVSVTDAEGDDVTVEATAIAGMTISATSIDVAGGNGNAVFTFAAESPVDGASGTTTITAYDAAHAASPVTDTADVTIDPVSYVAPAGALAAVPMATTAAIDAPVTVVVMAGEFPADAAFAFLNGVAVTTPDGGAFVPGTLNIGSIGGEPKVPDGVWGEMSPAPKSFFLPEDYMLEPEEVTDDTTLDYMGFNATPIEGGETTSGGDLFNFQMAFSAAGSYTLGFLPFQEVRRTFYSDMAAAEFDFGDISNDYDGIPNTITVN